MDRVIYLRSSEGENKIREGVSSIAAGEIVRDDVRTRGTHRRSLDGNWTYGRTNTLMKSYTRQAVHFLRLAAVAEPPAPVKNANKNGG